MNRFTCYLAIVILAAPLVGQSGDRANQQPGTPLVLAPSEPLTEPLFPKAKADKTESPALAGSASRGQRVRPAILELKPPGDPIYLVEEPEPEADPDRWRTYRRPKVEQFSRDADGIALQGYDVVSYSGEHAEKGKKEFSTEYGGTMWWFVTAEHRDLFTRAPDR